MKSTLIATVVLGFAALAGGSAFAAGGESDYTPLTNFTSNVSRADVQASVLAARANGTLKSIGEKDETIVFQSIASRAAVHAAAVESVQHPMVMIDKIGV